MSLLNRVKAGLSKRIKASKEQRQERHVKEAKLHKEVEEAKWQGYRKGTLAKARSEAFKRAKTKPKSRGLVNALGTRTKKGLNFMNMDVGTAFGGGMNTDFGAQVFGGQRISTALRTGTDKKKQRKT